MKRLFDTELFVPDDDTHFSTAKGGAKAVLAYQLDRLKLAETKLRTRDVALDVGAHVGLITRQLLHICPRVLAFEPNPANYECLQQNLNPQSSSYRNSSVTLMNIALGDHEGEAYIRGGVGNSGDSWIGFQSDKTKVNVRRFDFLAGDHADRTISLVKIDVQGSEFAVLRGMEQTLLKHKPVVIVECEKDMPSQRFGISDDAAMLYLASLGAVPFGKISADYLYYWPEGS